MKTLVLFCFKFSSENRTQTSILVSIKAGVKLRNKLSSRIYSFLTVWQNNLEVNPEVGQYIPLSFSSSTEERFKKKQNRAKQNKGGDAKYWKKSRNKNPPALSKLVIFSILYLRISTSWKTQHPADQTEHRVFLRLPAHTQHWECKEINSWWMKTDFFW